MIAPKFIRFRGDIINITKVIDVCFNSEKQQTAICYGVGEAVWGHYDGDHRDEIWGLIKLALRAKDEDPKLATPLADLVQRVESVQHTRRASDNVEPVRIPIGYTAEGDAVYEDIYRFPPRIIG